MLKDYYFIKLFKKEKYRDEANEGIKLRINNLKHFWTLQNNFQQDYEGKIFKQLGKGYFIKPNDDLKSIIEHSNSYQGNLKKILNRSEIICETTELTFKVHGFIYCFYLLPKSAVTFQNNRMFFTNNKDKSDFILFCQKFLEENDSFHGSIYDAQSLWYILCTEMTKRGYEIVADKVEYKILSEAEIIQLYQENKYKEIIFSKNVDYNYQKEYRFFFSKRENNTEEFVEEIGIELKKSRIADFDFNNI